MKITFNQTLQVNNYKPITRNNKDSRIEKFDNGDAEPSASPSLSLANFPNVSFKMNADMKFLLGQTNKLRCAYSGRKMISPYEVRTIYAKLAKKPNAMSAINYLIQYEDYMHDVESTVFELFKESPEKGKRNFQDILIEHQPDALSRLKIKQFEILNSTNEIIESMSEPVKEQVTTIRNNTIARMENGSFTRRGPLELIKKVKAQGNDLDKVIKVYQAWYKLPCSSKDLDAFIVKYAKESHESIAKRLISSAVATVEHILPQARKKNDDMENLILVSACFNNDRDTMKLGEYIMLNSDIDIPRNLQRYINDVIDEIHNPKSQFAQRSWYPEKIQKSIYRETNDTLKLNTNALKLTKAQIRENSYPQRLNQKFIVTRK